ncbi:hypothetical protein PP178_12450 [Zeaxanthinibacter sp. PT1]|uniref:hypothetical protein n=1 Tax=Zeaxanthinibacter TaxID=561554 RepID=UPI00234AC0A8|nr:hypothetical protein [Zeaxanthinibacter sp. PT1]MDC6352365.1 hypothetical protein [Zeaxanthinibacter sp. PT1]
MASFKLLLLTLLLMFPAVLLSQEVTFYAADTESIEQTTYTQVQHSIGFQEAETELMMAGIPGMIGDVLPSLVKYIPRLFYNPSKYVKEYDAEYTFIGPDAPASGIEPGKLMEFRAVGLTPTQQADTVAKIRFRTGNIPGKPGYHYIGLWDYDIYRTGVKLKPRSKSLNMVVEMMFTYFDDQHQKHEYVLQPMLLSALTPGQSGKNTHNRYQVLPKMNVLEKVAIKVTEVNAKKATWDQWMGIYEKNQNSISDFVKL